MAWEYAGRESVAELKNLHQFDRLPNFERYRFHVDKPDHVAVTGLDHPKRMFDLTEGLIGQGYSDADM
jgi:hypothetical protein